MRRKLSSASRWAVLLLQSVLDTNCWNGELRARRDLGAELLRASNSTVSCGGR